MISLIEKMQVVVEMLDSAGGIYLWQFDGNGMLIRSSATDTIIQSLFMKNGGSEKILWESACETRYPTIITDDFFLTWLIVPHRIENNLLGVWIAGPVFSSHFSESYLLGALRKKNLADDRQFVPISFIEQIPVIPHQILIHYAMLIYRLLYGENIAWSDILLESHKEETEPSAEGKLYSELDEYYILEREILNAVEQGNIHYVHPKSTLAVKVSKISNEGSLRQVKNTMISSITLVTRAAIKGGMTVGAAYSLCDYYILASESCGNATEVYSNWRFCLQDFTQRVHDIRRQNHSDLVNRCISYVQFHIYEPLTVMGIAEQIGYSKNYLGSCFHNETGKNLTQYIMEQKLELAALRLKHSSKSISDIAHEFGFESDSYFAAQFRKHYGVTPSEYRR